MEQLTLVIGGVDIAEVFMFILLFGIVGFVAGAILFMVQGGIGLLTNISPVQTVKATVLSKRAVTLHRELTSNATSQYNSSFTMYFATFEMENSEFIELRLWDKDYALLVEADVGKLTFQGKRFKEFKRERGF